MSVFCSDSRRPAASYLSQFHPNQNKSSVSAAPPRPSEPFSSSCPSSSDSLLLLVVLPERWASHLHWQETGLITCQINLNEMKLLIVNFDSDPL